MKDEIRKLKIVGSRSGQSQLAVAEESIKDEIRKLKKSGQLAVAVGSGSWPLYTETVSLNTFY